MKCLFFTLLAALPSSHLLAAELSVTILDVKGNPLSDMVVYAEPKSGIKDLKPNINQLTIDQKGKKFTPYATVMQKGQKIQFSNKDDITHHIYSVSGQNRFDFKLQAGQKVMTQQIKSSEEIAMGCNIHDWMSGFVLVVDTPYFGKTNKQGIVTFNLENTDEYKVTVWHPQLDTQTRKLSQSHIINNNNQTILMTLPKPLLHIPKQMGQEEFEFLEEY